MFQNIVSLIERVDDAASDMAAAHHPHSLQTSGLGNGHDEKVVAAPATLNQNATDVEPLLLDQASPSPLVSPSHTLQPAAAARSGEQVSPKTESALAQDKFRLIASAECSNVLVAAEVHAAHVEVAAVRHQSELYQQLLKRLVCAVRQVQIPSSTQPDLEQLCCEVDVAVGSSPPTASSPMLLETTGDSVDAVERLSSLLRIQQAKLDAISESNIDLRRRLAEEDEQHQKERESWSAQWGELSSQAERAALLTRDVERRKEESLHAWTKMSSMQTALRQSTERCTSLEQQLDALQRVLLIRDEELAISRAQVDKLRLGADLGGGSASTSGAASVSIGTNSRVLRTITSNKKIGPTVHWCVAMLDSVTMSGVRVLARQAWLRIFVALYFFLLHVHMFHVVSLVVHSGLPHEVGDDVHDHIKNHLVK